MPLGYEYTCETRLGPFFTNSEEFIANLPFLTRGPVVVSNGTDQITIDPLGAIEDARKELLAS